MKAMIIVNNGLEECEALITYDLLFRAGIKTDLVGLQKEILSSHELSLKAHELIDEIETGEGILSWVLIFLQTGRHHQIRVQFASRGLGLYGDTKYNPLFMKKKGYSQLGLYSTRLAFVHPGTKKTVTFKTDPKGEAFDLMDVEAY